MNPLYTDVAERAFGRCEYCRAPEAVFNFAFQVEHIHPQSLGGSDDAENLALACSSCNLYKSNAVNGWDDEAHANSPFFHPRTDVWTEHFQVNIETAEVVGLTAIGRVTVTRLQMNRPRQVAARHLWIRLGLFP